MLAVAESTVEKVRFAVLGVFDWQTETVHRPGQKVGMSLQLKSGKLIKNATEADIMRFVEGEEFAILSAEDDTYIQSAEQKDPPFGYVLEYQAGSIDRHFRAVDDVIQLDQILRTFTKYLLRDLNWRDDFRWARMDLS